METNLFYGVHSRGPTASLSAFSGRPVTNKRNGGLLSCGRRCRTWLFEPQECWACAAGGGVVVKRGRVLSCWKRELKFILLKDPPRLHDGQLVCLFRLPGTPNSWKGGFLNPTLLSRYPR